MSGYHAELFSYVLNLELTSGGERHDLAPLTLQPYQSVYMTDFEPHVLLTFEISGKCLKFAILSDEGQFRINVSCAELIDVPDVATLLQGDGKFSIEGGNLTRLVPREDIYTVLQDLAKSLGNLPN